MTTPRLLTVNFLIRIAAAGSGQAFAFLVAERMSSRVGVGALVVGATGAAFFVTELLGAPVAGRIADATGQVRVLRWGPMFGIASTLVAALTATGATSVVVLIAVLFVARFNEGASAACAVPTTLALLSRATDGDPERRTRVMGAFEATSLLGMITGYVVAGVAWDRLGTGVFLVLPPIYGLAWWLVGGGAARSERLPDARTDEGIAILAVLKRLASGPGHVAFGVAWLAINAVVGLWIQQAPFLLTLPERSATQDLVGGFTGQDVALVFAAWGVALLVGITLWSLLAANWPRRRTMTVALVGMMGVVVTLGWLNHGGPRALLGLALALVMVEAGFAPAAFAHLAELTKPLDVSRGTALGLYSVLLGAGQLAGNVLGGPFSARWQMDGVLGLTALLAVASLSGVLHMRSGTPRTVGS